MVCLVRAEGISSDALVEVFVLTAIYFSTLGFDGEDLVVSAEEAFLDRYEFRLFGRLDGKLLFLRR